MKKTIILAISDIRLDFQETDCLSDLTVEEYEGKLLTGTVVEPIHVYFDGCTYWLADGFHRMAAAKNVGRTEIEAEVTFGTYADMEAEFDRYRAAIVKSLRDEK